jgi:hypothetical protein
VTQCLRGTKFSKCSESIIEMVAPVAAFHSSNGQTYAKYLHQPHPFAATWSCITPSYMRSGLKEHRQLLVKGLLSRRERCFCLSGVHMNDVISSS